MPTKLPTLLLGLLLGTAAGLLYGWVLRPVQYFDTSPDALRIDYRSDYVLMVAEAYDADKNLELARIRLASLGPESPESYVQEALQYATQEAFSPTDITLLELLLRRVADPTRSTEPAQP